MTRLACLAALAAVYLAPPAQAAFSLAQVSIIDRDSGAALPVHYHRGEYWVAGSPGARYAIAIRNRLGERLLAVTSVDGVNVVTGATAAWDQSGYVFGAGESYQITGWRKSEAEVAAFSFTAAPHSYAERTGRPANVGVIGVALFRERPAAEPSPPLAGEPEGAHADRAQSIYAPSPRDAKAAPPNVQDAPKLGTGHGPREASYASHTQFVRLQPQPNEIIRIRYDSLENLIALGVVTPDRPRQPIPDAFPDSRPAYVPDPPG